MDKSFPVVNKPSVPTLQMPNVEKMITDIWMKIPLLETVSTNLDKLCRRTDKLEQEVREMAQQTSELETGLSHMETEQKSLKRPLRKKLKKQPLKS